MTTVNNTENPNTIEIQIQTFGTMTRWNARKGEYMTYNELEMKACKNFTVNSDISEQEIKALCLEFATEINNKYDHVQVFAHGDQIHVFNRDDLEVQEVAEPSVNDIQKMVSNGKIFAVTFTKRSTGTVRKMVCRTNVRKHLRGGSKAYSPAKHNLLSVFDMQAKAYRSVPLDAITSLKANGEIFNFRGAV